MELATIASGAATAWLVDKAAQSVGIDLGKVAKAAVDDVVGVATTVARLRPMLTLDASSIPSSRWPGRAALASA